MTRNFTTSLNNLPKVRVHDVRHVRHAHRRVEVRLADEQLRPRHQVPQLQPRDLAAEGVLQLLAEALDDGEAAVRAAQEHLGLDGVVGMP